MPGTRPVVPRLSTPEGTMIRGLHHSACHCRDPEQTRAFYEDFLVCRWPLRWRSRKRKAAGIETRGVSDHGFIHSIYFPDPNGYVIELTAKRPDHDRMMDPSVNGAREKLDRWIRGRVRTSS